MTTPGLGEIVYLASCAIQVAVSAVTTDPSTPNQYTADLKLMGDSGMNLDALVGPSGDAGQALPNLRDATEFGYEPVNDPDYLPVLTNSAQDIGLYWLIDVLDDQGHILAEWCYVWWGAFYRQIMMGTVGAPGAVPEIDLDLTVVSPSSPGQVLTSGTTLAPSWQFLLPCPAGPPGYASPLYGFPDVNVIAQAPQDFNILTYTGNQTYGGPVPGAAVWTPFDFEQYLPQTWSMPTSAFVPYVGVSQRAPIGKFTLPPQTFPWTPVVWGHICVGGLTLGTDPLMVGCEVLMNSQDAGTMVGRGLGTTLGEVNIMPHYSSPGNRNAHINPTAARAVVPAGDSCTLYVNLWNDGQLGVYSFWPTPFDSSLQSQLDVVSEALGHPIATIEGVVGLLGAWGGAITDDIQMQLNAVSAMIGTSPGAKAVNATIADVGQYLTQFQPLVNALADALGITEIEDVINQVVTELESFASSITTAIQDALDAVANEFGLSGSGHTISTVASQLAGVQPAIQNLADLLGGNTVNTVIGILNDFTGSVGVVEQDALNGLAGVLGFSPIAQTISSVQGILTDFQSAVDGVAVALGGVVGSGIADIVGLLGPWIGMAVTDVIQLPVDILSLFLGATGTENTIATLLSLLIPLLGDVFSGYTTDAQMFMTVLPMLDGLSESGFLTKIGLLASEGVLSATAVKGYHYFVSPTLHNTGTLSCTTRVKKFFVHSAPAGHGALSAGAVAV